MTSWTPTSEKLPENTGPYLVIGVSKNDHKTKIQVLSFCEIKHKFHPQPVRRWHDDGVIIPSKVLFWSPLPTPPSGITSL